MVERCPFSALSPAYVAGFFDGEGCIDIFIRGKSRQVSIRASIVNTDLNILKLIHAQYGGFIHSGKERDNGWKIFRSLIITGKYAINLIHAMMPYLIVKKSQAMLALEFWEFMQLPRMTRCYIDIFVLKNGKNHARVLRRKETIEKELWFKQEMHNLNRKGRH